MKTSPVRLSRPEGIILFNYFSWQNIHGGMLIAQPRDFAGKFTKKTNPFPGLFRGATNQFAHNNNKRIELVLLCESLFLRESLRKYDKIASVFGKGVSLGEEGTAEVYLSGSISSTNIFFLDLIVMSPLMPGGFPLGRRGRRNTEAPNLPAKRTQGNI